MKIISIILPTHNGSKFISGAINSILLQTYKNWELIIVDDGSTDNTGGIVKEYTKKDTRILFFQNKNNLGIQKTLNLGLKIAKGEYIARIDDDDVWSDEGKLESQINFLELNREHVLVGTGVVVLNENKKEIKRYFMPELDNEIRKKILIKNCFVHSSVMFCKKTALKFNGYDESSDTRHVEDYDLWLKMGTVGKFANIQTYSVEFTKRDGSVSSKNKFEQYNKSYFLAKKYKNNYSNYFYAYIIYRLRVLFFYLGNFLSFLK